MKIFNDPVLGDMRLAGEGWWDCSPTVNGRLVGFKVGGEGTPDPKLVAHAHDIVHSFAKFESQITEFLVNEAHNDADLLRKGDSSACD